MTPTMNSYTPSLYQPDSYGRFRQYPHNVTTPIPGAGYDVGEMVWAEQELNLDGSGRPQPYGNYARVPLRGLGQNEAEEAQPGLTPTPLLQAPVIPPVMMRTELAPETFGPGATVSSAVASALEAARRAEAAQTQESAAVQDGGFFAAKVGPVPVWALGLGGLVAVGGGAWYFMRRRRVKPNRRRRAR